MALRSPAGRATWGEADTARYFEEFCRRHARYRNANRKLAAHAHIGKRDRVLDFAAGTGRTAQAILAYLGPKSVILCVEPSRAMRTLGRARLRDRRVVWAHCLPDGERCWDRILCGAAIWQLHPLQEWLNRFARLLAPAGALCFNVPSLYLGEAERPGGGEDPLLLALPGLLYARRTASPPPARVTIHAAPQIDEMLRNAGLQPERWQVRTRLSYAAYRQWLKIPVITEGMFAGLPADARAALIDEAFAKVDQRSWRWEAWTGWTARKGRG